MENAGVPRNHIIQLMGHEDDNMALDVYSGGLAIEPLRKSMEMFKLLRSYTLTY